RLSWWSTVSVLERSPPPVRTADLLVFWPISRTASLCSGTIHSQPPRSLRLVELALGMTRGVITQWETTVARSESTNFGIADNRALYQGPLTFAVTCLLSARK